MRFLMIENDIHVAPSIDMIMTIGLTDKRGQSGFIGRYGSGGKNSLPLFARISMDDGSTMLDGFVITAGKNVCNFEAREQIAKSADNSDRPYKRIWMIGRDGESKNSKRQYDLNITDEWGSMDWVDVSSAIREYVANAIDGQSKFDGGAPNIEILDKKPRAKDGKFRVFIPVNDDVQEYFDNLKMNFARLRPNWNPDERVMRRNSSNPMLCMYKDGVKVFSRMDKNNHPALFSYEDPDIYIDESRNADSWSVRSSVSKAITLYASAEQYAQFLLSTKDGNSWESNNCDFDYMSLDRYYLDDDKKKERESVISEAWRIAFGNAVMVENSHDAELVERKGKRAQIINKDLAHKIAAHIEQSANKVLSKDEREGRTIVEPNDMIRNEYTRVWDMIVSFVMHDGKNKPPLKAFSETMRESCQTGGFYRPEETTVYIHIDKSGVELTKVILEELTHFITGADDLSRDFQDFLLRFSARMMQG